MKTTLLAVAAAMAVAIATGRLEAGQAAPAGTAKPDWHYRWHEGRWWYWIPENHKWMVWVGSLWIPYEQFASRPDMFGAGQPLRYSVGYGSYEAPNEGGAFAPAYAAPAYSAPAYSAPMYSGGGYGTPYHGSGAGSGFSGYGWSWGPGTAFQNGPGPRF
jgi:hypothetical protein